MEAQKKYYEEINIMKGIAAVLVVLGHAIRQTDQTNPVFEAVFSIIYSFHMPLFFFAAGFLGTRLLEQRGMRERLSYAKSRFLRLMVPYLVVSFLYAPFKYLLAVYAREPYDFSEMWRILVGESPDGALWFLYVLFWVSLLAAFIVSLRTLPALLAVTLAASVLSSGINWQTELGYQLSYFPFFFLLGLFVRKNYGTWQDKIYCGKTVFLAFLGFVLGNVLSVDSFPLFLGLADGASGNISAVSVLSGMITVFTAVSGILCTLALAKWIAGDCGKRPEGNKEEWNRQEMSRLRRCANMLGDYCMDIYIVAEPVKVAVRIVFWSVLGWNYVVCILLCFAVSLIFSVFISKYLLRRFRLLRFLILGMPYRKKGKS